MVTVAEALCFRGARPILTNVIYQERLEDIFSDLLQTSIWTQERTDYMLAVRDHCYLTNHNSKINVVSDYLMQLQVPFARQIPAVIMFLNWYDMFHYC